MKNMHSSSMGIASMNHVRAMQNTLTAKKFIQVTAMK